MNVRSSSALRRRARGVTLIEVLVALVIVAVGLLGLAGLQVRGLSIQKDAHGRAIATQLALDLADRMRANRDPATRVPPVDYMRTDSYPGPDPIGVPVADCAAVACDIAQQAQYDLLGAGGWLQRVRTALPGGWARVEPIDATNQVWDVTVMWVETGLRARSVAEGKAGMFGSNCPAGTPPEVECQTIRVRP